MKNKKLFFIKRSPRLKDLDLSQDECEDLNSTEVGYIYNKPY